MKSVYYQNISLKVKMALAVALIFVLFIVVASTLTLSYFERTFKQSIYEQQFSLVSSLANSIDDKLRIAQGSLVALASTVPEGTLENASKAQSFLNRVSGFHSIFDNNISFISMQGRLVAESRFLPGRRGKDFSYRQFFKQTLASQKPYVSDPYLSTHLPIHPAIMITAPVFDEQGKMTGMLTGSIDLLGRNFLADLSKVTVGRSGYLCLMDSERVLLVHPDKERIMKLGAAPGANRLYDRAVDGFEGSGENVNSSGVPLISSYKHLRSTSWILGSNYPLAEAYAPLYQVKRYLRLGAGAATVVLLLVTWLIMRRLLTPLAIMTRHVRLLSENPELERHLDTGSADEIGLLARAFNKMIDTLDRQQQALQEQTGKIEDERALLQTLIDAIPDMIFYKDRNSVYQGCNEAFATSFLGRTKDEVIGRCDHDFEPTAQAAGFFHRNDQEAMSRGDSLRQDFWVTLNDGRLILAETLKAPFRDAVGKVKGVIGISHDITDRRRMEDELRSLNAELEQNVANRTADLKRLNRELESFCYSISHELRAPIARLMGFSRLLTEAAASSPELRTDELPFLAERIGVASLRLREVIDSLLLLNRLSRVEIRCERINLSELAESIVGELLEKADGRAVQVRITPDIVVHRDKSMLEICLRNLLDNALKFSSKKAEAEVEFGRVVLAGESVFFVKDNGAGFDLCFAEKLFEPFSRLHSEDEFEGSGMGLPAAQMIVERHGGRIWAEAQEGRGAIFYFTLGEEILPIRFDGIGRI